MRAAATRARGATDATRRAYRCFEPYGESAEDYARATALVPTSCENEAVATLRLLRERAVEHRADGPETFFNAEQNALVARNAERYYEAVLHHTGIPDFLLPFAEREAHPVMDDLREPRGHRAIGVVYHPELEQHGNYVPTRVPAKEAPAGGFSVTDDFARLRAPCAEHDEHERTGGARDGGGFAHRRARARRAGVAHRR